MNVHQDQTTDPHAALNAAAERIADARHWPDFIATAYAGFELATRTARALVDTSPFTEHIRLAEAERAATDGRDILRAAPGRMNAEGPLGPPIVLATGHITGHVTGHVAATETSLSRLADTLFDRFALALDEPLNADELVAFSEAMDAADRLQHALSPSRLSQDESGRDESVQGSRRTDVPEEVDDGDLP